MKTTVNIYNLYIFAQRVKFMKYLERLYDKVLFTKQDIKALTGNDLSARMMLLYYCKRGYIKQIRRNLYGVVNPITKNIEANKMQIASAISETAYLAYHSALEYYGTAHQTFFELTIVSATRFNYFEFEGIGYKYVKNTIQDGVVSRMEDSKVRVTSLERTIIDCIDRIDLAGGCEELFHCLEAVKYADQNLLLHFLELYNKKSLYNKTGYVLENKTRIPLSENFYDICLSRGKNCVSRIAENNTQAVFNKKWHLYVPQDNVDNYDV